MTQIDFDALVQPTRIHGSLYTSPSVHDAELSRIFHQGWVFLAHDSEVASPGDYVTRTIGGQPLIVARGRDDVVRAFFNRCTHRANLVCRADAGNASSFRCPYHGWTFASDGALTVVPMREGYGTDHDDTQARLGLAPIAELDSYRGFVFGRLTGAGPSLSDHLGKATTAIDRLVDLSPTGKLNLRNGWIRHLNRANWRTLLEKQVDGYHALFVHQSVYRAVSPRRAEYGSGETRIAVRDLGGGHCEIDYTDEWRRLDREFAWFGNIDRARVPRYIEAMTVARDGRLRQLLVDGPPHTVIFPNLFLAELNVMMFEPLAPGQTVVHTAPALLDGGEEMNERILRRAEGAMGPAGFLIADDADMSERNQIGLEAGTPEWVELSRGLESEETDIRGTHSFDESAETTQRAIWQHYRSVMTGVHA